MGEPDAKRLKPSNETESDVLVPSYGHLLERVGKCLTKDNVEALATIAELTQSEKCEVTSSGGNGSRFLFKRLEQKGIISRYDTRWLQQNLREIDNELAAKIIDDLISDTEEEFELPSEPECSENEDEDETTFEKFLEKVGLKNKYPAKLKLETFLQLGTDGKSNYAHLFWQKLTTLNYQASILQELVSQDCSMRDFIFCVLHCGDAFLRQDILEKMSACQLAIPVLLQGVANSKPMFLLWALRRVMKKWRGESDSCSIEQPIISYPVLNISFLRIGDVRLSKSQLLNTMLSNGQGYSAHTFFLNREKDFLVPRFSPGSVECVWFLPMRERENQIFKEVTAFFNLRGDCTKYPQQTEFACKAAHLTVALIATSKHKIQKRCVSQIRKNSKSTLFISISEEESRATTSQKVHAPKYKDGCIFVNVVQMDILSKTICEEIVRNCKISDTAKTCLESLADICGENIQTDEQDKKKTAKRLGFQCVKSLNKAKADWKDWVEIDKVSLQVETEVNESFEHQTESKTLKKREKRNSQVQTNLSPTMEVFLRIMKDAKSNSALLRYIFGFMHEKIYHIVNESTRNDMNNIAELEKEIRQIRDQMITGSDKNDNENSTNTRLKSINPRNESSLKVKTDACNKLYKSCRAKNFGGEYFLRELGQLYEAYMELHEEQLSQPKAECTSEVILLPSLAARLVTEMQSLEIMDGDTGCIPLTWVTSVLDTLTRELNDPKVLVLSVIGVQSSGKSTLLNSMFGVRFPVRAGRCTRGLFIQLLKLEDGLSKELGFQYLIIVDSEGISSIERDDRRFDNELVTLALSIANVTIFNIDGENFGPEMTGILQIAAHALIRMKEVDLTCHCRIVQQRVSDMTAADRNKANTKKINEILNEVTRSAAEQEGLEGRYQQFSDVVDLYFDEDLQYIPCLWTGGMAPPNHMYGETVTKIRVKLFEDIKKGNIVSELTLFTFTERIRDVWKAIKEEDFVFNFHDSVKAVDFNQLCLFYNKCIVQVRQDVEANLNRILSNSLFLRNLHPKGEYILPDVESLKISLNIAIDHQRRKLSERIEDYIAKHPRKNVMTRHRQEFLRDANAVLDEVESNSLVKLMDEYEIQKISLNLPQFQKRSRQIFTLEAKTEASAMRNAAADLTSDDFDAIWQKLMVKIRKQNNITQIVLTPSSLKSLCEKLLLRVTRDMAVASEIQALLSREGGVTNHLSLDDCEKYISLKYIKSWLRYNIESTRGDSAHVHSDDKKRRKEATRPSNMSSEGNVRPVLDDAMKQANKQETSAKDESFLIDEKKRQAVMILREVVESNIHEMRWQGRGFDVNRFQLALQKTLKELSAKHETLKYKLPYRLIAKGLLYFCGRAITEASKNGNEEIENYLDVEKSEIHEEFNSFLYEKDHSPVAARFISYYIRRSLKDRIVAFRDNFYDTVDYTKFVQSVQVPWDLLLFWMSDVKETYFNDNYNCLVDLPIEDVVHLYLEHESKACANRIVAEAKPAIVLYASNLIEQTLDQVKSQATTWEEWTKSLGNFVSCSFIQMAGDLFDVTEISQVSRLLTDAINSEAIFLDLHNIYKRIDYSAVKNATGLSYVCKEVCPMCGVWCDNILESHTVHSSSCHRPRGLKGETYCDNNGDGDGDSSSCSSSTSDDNTEVYYGESASEDSSTSTILGEPVLEDCNMSILSETATFTFKGQKVLCKNFKDVFPNWDIRPEKNCKYGKIFWKWYFSTNIEGFSDWMFRFSRVNIPLSWDMITYDEAAASLYLAKMEESQGRQAMASKVVVEATDSEEEAETTPTEAEDETKAK
ncbi:Interferon-induced very large GTPase 1 [Holothuria leucospilota]|uniref:Interferon-induced very large GTPase 1 n=1 Tax=Holothuria leucospilota TaxID=206669 RepID=A0A9Q1CBC5_HOLLE|nr:Interferon-induced very large GTPase 1 [Holothuria leucospilota]